MQQQPLLQTESLQVGYTAEKPLLQALDLALYHSTLTVLLGRNGSGKSTLMRTLAGLQPALAGNIRTAKGEITAERNYGQLARQIAVVLTERPHTQFMSGYELVALGRAPYTSWTGKLTARDRELVEQALQVAHAADLRHALIDELSDGQCQKLMIARALAQDTPVLLLDEPTAHLDLDNSALLLNSLTQYTKQTRKAILLSTHHIELALHAADFIWLIDNSNQLHVGIPEQLALEGQISNLFSDTHVFFNQHTGHFDFPPPPTPHTLVAAIHLPKAHAFWLTKALAKHGICLQHNPEAKGHIRLANHYRFVWQCDGHGQTADLQGIVQILTQYAHAEMIANFN